MDQYLKTELGIQVLRHRSVKLNVRQRQLLLLIGTDDFKILNPELKHRLATPELIQQLESLALIFKKSYSKPQRDIFNSDSSIHPQTFALEQTKLTIQNALTQIEVIDQNSDIKDNNNLKHLNFADIQLLMTEHLQKHCGLMSKQLIFKIQQSKELAEIKACQMQWITALQETKMSPIDLNQTMKQINHSLTCLQNLPTIQH